MARRSVRSVSTKDCTSPLKVCPFCGGDARIHSKVLADGFDSGYWAVCDECGKGDTLPHESEEEAAAAWNARAAVTDGQFAMAVHDGRPWQVVRECVWDIGLRKGDDGTQYFTECGEVYILDEPYPRCPSCGGVVKVALC